jgi:hypothetical protein
MNHEHKMKRHEPKPGENNNMNNNMKITKKRNIENK